MSPLRRAHSEERTSFDDGDRWELRALAQSGAELGAERLVQHYLINPTRDGAATATLQLREAGFEAAFTENPTAQGWIVVAERAEALDEETLHLSRSLLELIAERCGATYDGWRTELLESECANETAARTDD